MPRLPLVLSVMVEMLRQRPPQLVVTVSWPVYSHLQLPGIQERSFRQLIQRNLGVNLLFQALSESSTAGPRASGLAAGKDVATGISAQICRCRRTQPEAKQAARSQVPSFQAQPHGGETTTFKEQVRRPLLRSGCGYVVSRPSWPWVPRAPSPCYRYSDDSTKDTRKNRR